MICLINIRIKYLEKNFNWHIKRKDWNVRRSYYRAPSGYIAIKNKDWNAGITITLLIGWLNWTYVGHITGGPPGNKSKADTWPCLNHPPPLSRSFWNKENCHLPVTTLGVLHKLLRSLTERKSIYIPCYSRPLFLHIGPIHTASRGGTGGLTSLH